MRPALPILLGALLAAGCGGASARPSAPAPHPLFAYDRGAPLRYEDHGVVNHGYPVKVHDVSYASPKGGRVPGYLAVPPGKGPFPAVVYMHGTGGDRLELLVAATWLAARGAVGLTITSPFERRPRPRTGPGVAGLRKERDLVVQNVVDLRRAVDVLRSLPQVDPGRIGFVGYSAGAKVGAILAGVERRIRAYDLMSGGSAPSARFARLAPAGLRQTVARLLGQIDPLRYVGRAAPAALLFQDGKRDRIVPRAQLRALASAGSEPKEVRWYDAGHGLDARAYRDQLRWLSRRLGVRGPVVPGARTGP